MNRRSIVFQRDNVRHWCIDEGEAKEHIGPWPGIFNPIRPIHRSALICFRFYITFFDSKILKAAQVIRRNLLRNNTKASYEILVI